jgi:outer membrane receptor for ferrienterochelin and colicin
MQATTTSALKILVLMVIPTVFCCTAVWAAEEEGGGTKSDLAEMSIEDLMNVEVYGASKFQQKLSEAPSSVTIVTADEIKKYGYRNLADVLRSVRGFVITNDRDTPMWRSGDSAVPVIITVGFSSSLMGTG